MIIKDNSKAVLASFERASEAALIACAQVVEGRSALLCPVKTGRLRGSITYVVGKAKSKEKNPAKQGDGVQSIPEPGVAYVGTNVEYAAHVEFGTRRMKPQSFLRLAADNSKSDLSAVYTGTFNKVFGK